MSDISALDTNAKPRLASTFSNLKLPLQNPSWVLPLIMMNNPFTPQTLVGRETELRLIQRILLKDGDFVLVGAPGTGRRTLLREAARAANARILDIDCLRSTSGHQFLRLLAGSIMTCFSRPEELALLQAWSTHHPLTIEGSPASQAHMVWHLPTSKEWPLFEALLALPQHMAETLDCRVVIMFQNFPHIRSWDRQGKWETYLKQEIRYHNRVSYALVATVVEPWIHDSRLDVVDLLPLEDGVMRQWLIKTMQAQGLSFSSEDGAIALFLSYVQGHLGDAIALARRIWLDHHAFHYSDSTLQAHHVHRSMLAIVEDMSVTFESLIMLLPSSQSKVLESLALDPTDSPQARDYIKKHQLSRGGGLQGALNSLEQKGLIYGANYGYRVALPFLEFWLKHRLAWGRE